MSNAPQTLTLNEANLLLSFLKRPRNYCMGLLMLDAGLRVGEVTRLLVTDVVLNDQPVKAVYISADICKTNTERLIPLSQRTQRAIGVMYHAYWKNIRSLPVVFAFFRNNSSKPLSCRQVQRIIKRAAMMSLGRAVHPHILRHTFATRMMRVTSTPVVQRLLGHKQLSSTQIYTHPNQDDLQKAIDAAC